MFGRPKLRGPRHRDTYIQVLSGAPKQGIQYRTPLIGKCQLCGVIALHQIPDEQVLDLDGGNARLFGGDCLVGALAMINSANQASEDAGSSAKDHRCSGPERCGLSAPYWRS